MVHADNDVEELIDDLWCTNKQINNLKLLINLKDWTNFSSSNIVSVYFDILLFIVNTFVYFTSY
jgi:hypothetical protein